MSVQPKKLKTCDKGHSYYKTSDCPICPYCEKMIKPETKFLAAIAAPARRALLRQGITTLQKLSEYSEQQVLFLHGMGPNAISKLKSIMAEQGIHFMKY